MIAVRIEDHAVAHVERDRRRGSAAVSAAV